MWRCEIPKCCFQNTVIRIRPPRELSQYLLIVFKNFYFNGVFSEIAGGVGINHLGAEKFSIVRIPVPPLAEQRRIVAEVERRLSVIEELEAFVNANLKRAERLRQSILKRAFEGKLVPQDRNDEPASVLLGRIRAERKATGEGDASPERGNRPKKKQP